MPPEGNDVNRCRRLGFHPNLKQPPRRCCRRPNPTSEAGCGDGSAVALHTATHRDAGHEKCQEKHVRESAPVETGKASQQQAEPANSATEARSRKREGTWRGEEGRDQKKPQLPSPPMSQPLSRQPRIKHVVQDLQQLLHALRPQPQPPPTPFLAP
jgi:hypothetical protein